VSQEKAILKQLIAEDERYIGKMNDADGLVFPKGFQFDFEGTCSGTGKDAADETRFDIENKENV
jgi:hypothetical protein